MKKCLNCMHDLEQNTEVCPYCGYNDEVEDYEVYQLKPGTMLQDRYLVGTILGFGGFGVVYKAWDTTLQRVVAIKEYFPTIYITRNGDSQEVIIFDKKNVPLYEKGKKEFLDEAQSIARFNKNPNIVHIYDFFEANGTAYFVMEYLNGFTLKTYMNDARKEGKVFSWESAVYVAKEILKALNETHIAGIIHRDIKPANIHILPDGTVKILDFGAARLYDSEQEKTRTVIITPGYAAPEQYQKKSKQGPYTDIYAVGSLLYEMLTEEKLDESINRKVIDDTVNPKEINSKIPDSICNAVMRSIAVQPEIRFKDTTAFLSALSENPRTKVRDAQKEIKHRLQVRNTIIALVVCAVLVVGGIAAKLFVSNYESAVLVKTDVHITVPAINDDIASTEALYDDMLSEFYKSYPQVNVEINVSDKADYLEVAQNELKKDDGSDIVIFDSEDILPPLEVMGDISKVYEDNAYAPELYPFLEKFKTDFISEKRVPLVFEVPILYENQLKSGLPESENYEEYKEGKASFVGTTSDYSRIQEEMAGIYMVKEGIYPKKPCKFTSWICTHADLSDTQTSAINRIILSLLSDNAQEKLSIEQDSGLPINKNVFDLYIELNEELGFLDDQLDNMVFKIYY